MHHQFSVLTSVSNLSSCKLLVSHFSLFLESGLFIALIAV